MSGKSEKKLRRAVGKGYVRHAKQFLNYASKRSFFDRVKIAALIIFKKEF